MNVVIPDQRILHGVAATLRFENTNSEGELEDAAGSVTVGVVDADGATVLAAGTPATKADTGIYTVDLPASATADLGLLTATWTDAGDSSVHTTTIEIAGGFLFTVARAREDRTLANTVKYPAQAIIDARLIVEAEAEAILGFSPFPRRRTVTVDGSGERDLHVPDRFLRTVVAASIDGTALGSDALDELTVGEHLVLTRPAGQVWTWGRSNVTVTYEHGINGPQHDLVGAAVRRCRHWANQDLSQVPDIAESWTVDGVTYRLGKVTAYQTGDPLVDAVYGRLSLLTDGHDTAGGGPAPASRPLQFDPQYGSLYHGGRA